MGIQYHNNHLKRRLQHYYNMKEVPEKISRISTPHLLTPQNITFLKAIGLEVLA